MKRVLITIGFFVALILALSAPGWLEAHPREADRLLGAGVCGLVVVGIFAGSLWSAWLMRTGASLAGEAGRHRAASDRAESDRDRALIGAFGRILDRRPDVPQLPPPAQGWEPYQLPAPSETVDHDDIMA